jgi:Gpi18-like mannosyltransferase
VELADGRGYSTTNYLGTMVLVVRIMSHYQCINTFIAVLCSASEHELHSAESSDIRPFLTEEFSFIVR